MTRITIEIDDQIMARVATVARSRHASVESLLAEHASMIGSLAPIEIDNPAHRKLMSNVVRPPGYYETAREESYDRDRQRAEIYAANKSRLLRLIDETEGDMGDQGWSRERLYVR
ncbi:MAG: hypothetical protein K2Z25_17300 [Beijerinckiaceae bacterium]|nr:hypothetical protein [Beijerinckiaceae bacterium]